MIILPSLMNLTGKKFKKLLVLEYMGNSLWKCECDCGNIKNIHSQALRTGKVISCGCNKKQDLTGKKFGRLTVIRRIGFINKRTYYECKCACGKIINVISSNLLKGTSNSCGCYANELTSKRSKTHGMSKTRLYGIWEGMKQRCYNPNVSAYKYYGNKGIKVCDEWLHNFENFKNWSKENNYNDDLSIDRIDIKGNYSPKNCRWVNKDTQANNTSTNVFLTINGVDNTIANWAKLTGTKASTIGWRHRQGWADEQCVYGKINTKK